MCHIFYFFFFFLTFIFLNFKTNVVTNLNPLNSDNNYFILFLVPVSVSLSCSSRLKEFKI